MLQMTLRQLARAYAEGELDKDNYRENRGELIAGILAGDIQVPEHEDLPPVRPRPDDATVEQATERRLPKKKVTAPPTPALDPPPPPAQPREDTGEPRRFALIAGIVAACLIIVALLIFYLGGATGPGGAAEDATSFNSTPAPGSATATPGQKLIASFLRDRTWTDQRLSRFVDDWHALSDEEKNAVAGTVAMGQLTNAIYKQLLEEQALSGLKNGEAALERQRQLVEFAHRIGIEDPRIALPDPSDESTPDGAAKDQADVQGRTGPVPEGSQASAEDCRAETEASARPAYCRDLIPAAGEYAPTMVVVPPGHFLMGDDREQERPRHRVVIDYSFAVSVHEITYGEFSLFCRMTNRDCPRQPWFGKDYPVVNITWNQARDYTRWLTDNTGNRYRLPSEAEWEYAARAGTETAYPTGNDIGHHDAVFAGGPQSGGPLPKTDRSINRNAFQIYHMAGNVREWTLDNWHGNYAGAPADGSAWTGDSADRVVRGGSYADSRDALRSAARLKLPATNADRYTGFRIVEELEKRDS